MKFKMTCEVVSKTVIEKEIEILYNGRQYIFSPDDKGALNKLTVIAEIEHPEKFYSEITPNPSEGVKLHIQGKADVELYESVVKDFQDLESLIAFKYNLKSIKWDTPEYDLIFETEEEKQKANLSGFKAWRKYRDYPMRADKDGLFDLVSNRDTFSSLIVPMSFYREGLNEKNSFRYISAFYNFYFILEGLYGNKKTKNTAIEAEFKKSTDFTGFVDSSLEFVKNEKPEYYNKIVEMLTRRGKTVNAESIIELIVSIRGEIHHFNNNPKRVGGTPFTHREFEAIATFVMLLAMKAIWQKIVDINEGKIAS